MAQMSEMRTLMIVSKKDKKKLSKLRKTYLNYVYDHYINTALLTQIHDESERFELALAKSYEVKSILSTYLKEGKINHTDYEIIKNWSKAKFDVFHIIEAQQDSVILYNTKRKVAVQAFLMEDSIKGIISKAPIEMVFRVSLIPYKHVFMADAVQVIQDNTSVLKYMEKLYEDYRKVIQTKGLLTGIHIYKDKQMPPREVKSDITSVFMDFIGPYNLHILDDVNLHHLCTLGILAWNAATIKGSMALKDVMKDDKAFFQILKTRKCKYFSFMDIAIRSYKILYNNNGFYLSMETEDLL